MRAPEHAAALARALGTIAAGRLLGEQGLALPARASTGRRAILHVLPLSHGRVRGRVEPGAVAMVFMTSDLAPANLPRETLAALYDLTPAETRVCELLSEGATSKEIAVRIGVAQSTVRTHLLRIFEKTGTHRQADVIRLMASLQLSRSP